MDQPFFSVLIPVYNVERYLPECLASIDAQTYTDYEVVLVDDGSPDGSPAILDAWCAERPYAKVIHKENEGLYLARYTGRQNARGRYFVFVDSDDCVHPALLERLREVIDEAASAPDMVCYNYSFKKDFSTKDNKLEFPAGTYTGANIAELKESLALGKMNNIITKCCAAELFDGETIVPEHMHLTYGEDWILSASLIGKVSTVEVIDDILYFYRTNPESAVHEYRTGILGNYRRLWRMLFEAGTAWGGDYPALFRRGIAGDAFGVVMRLCLYLPRGGDFNAEAAKLRTLISENDLQNVIAADGLERYHDCVISLFMGGHYTLVKLLLRSHGFLKRHEKIFKRLKAIVKGN